MYPIWLKNSFRSAVKFHKLLSLSGQSEQYQTMKMIGFDRMMREAATPKKYTHIQTYRHTPNHTHVHVEETQFLARMEKEWGKVCTAAKN